MIEYRAFARGTPGTAHGAVAHGVAVWHGSVSRARADRAFTVLEIAVALTFLLVGMVLVTQVATVGLAERERTVVRQEALEHAANVLERARALPWEELTPQWAAGQKLPEALGRRLTEPRLSVRVEPEANLPRTKRVTVVVRWKERETVTERPVELVGLFSARSAPAPGGKP